MDLNLVLAVFWLLLGGVLLVLPWLIPDTGDWTILGTGLSAGWLGIVLALYNLARWGARRTTMRQRRLIDELAARRGGDRGVAPSEGGPFTLPSSPDTGEEEK